MFTSLPSPPACCAEAVGVRVWVLPELPGSVDEGVGVALLPPVCMPVSAGMGCGTAWGVPLPSALLPPLAPPELPWLVMLPWPCSLPGTCAILALDFLFDVVAISTGTGEDRVVGRAFKA